MILPDISFIATRRKKLELTQKELAQAAGVSQSLIAKLEAGKLEPSYLIMQKLISTLDRLEHGKEKTCSSVMSSPIISLQDKETIAKASHLLKSKGISQIAIFRGKQLVGSISESSIINALTGDDGQEISRKGIFNKSIKEIMDPPFPTLPANTPLSSALPLLKTVSALLLTEKEKIVGILTKADVL
ncbi:MAG: CBS domain-containing protein [Nanoarchaeota archaeon]|nr:CBS domain-containing protein [Nanoarchaeota archaeon]